MPIFKDCWYYAGSINNYGYGYITIWLKEERRQTSIAVHRAVYESERGLLPEGLVMDHLCRVRSCINPDHLEPVSVKENFVRGEGRNSLNSLTTHCLRGHEFTPSNTITWKNGHRRCRTCENTSKIERNRRYKERKRLKRLND